MPVTLTGAAKASHERKVLTDAARREMCSRRPGSAHATATLLVAAVTAGMQHTCGNSRNDPGDCPASLRASGWTDEGAAGGGQWKHTDGKPRRTDQPIETKGRWAKPLSPRPDLADVPSRLSLPDVESLFDGESA